jgi:hypothetical protein
MKLRGRSTDLDLYDSTGSAVAYISLDEDMAIYMWSGKPVAYVDGESVYGFNGEHIGWFQKGIVHDNEGKVVAALARRIPRCCESGSSEGTKTTQAFEKPEGSQTSETVLYSDVV